MSPALAGRLKHVHLSARGLFYEMKEFLQKGDPYGTLDMDLHQLAEEIGEKHKTVEMAMAELKRAGIIIGWGGTFRCPLMVDERKNNELRTEIRSLVARWKKSPEYRVV